MSDPKSWISAERDIITGYASSNAASDSNLTTQINAFQTQMALELATEFQFTNDLATLTETLNTLAFDQTLQNLQSTDDSIDASFNQLQTAILQNNASSSNLLNQLVSSSNDIQRINHSQQDILSKITNYQSILSTFRTQTGPVSQ